MEICVRYIQLDYWDFDFMFCSLLQSFNFNTENKSHIIKHYVNAFPYSLGSKNVSFVSKSSQYNSLKNCYRSLVL